LVSTAGQKGSVRFVLRQSEDKRFNQLFDATSQVEIEMNSVVQPWRANNLPEDASKAYTFWISENEDYNDFTVTCFTKIASEIRDDIVFFLYITDMQGQKHKFAQNITMYVHTDVPDLSKTVITRDMPALVNMEELNEIRFKIFDQFDNPIKNNKAEFLQNFVVKPIEGALTYNSTEWDADLNVVRKLFGINDQHEYIVNIQQNYPPRVMKFDILYIMSVSKDKKSSIMYPIRNTPFVTQVKPLLADYRTQVYGDDVGGVQIGEDLTIYIALKDINNYCYDSDDVVPVSVRIDGPYEHPDSEKYLAETRTKVVDFTTPTERKIIAGK